MKRRDSRWLKRKHTKNKKNKKPTDADKETWEITSKHDLQQNT